ncbi:hypothetical protein [Congregibacter sp.]|uniref:hypothetical protein n=1 Tax=Congregibacter sp. TaxID=2744308 RepID=UPI003F6D1964
MILVAIHCLLPARTLLRAAKQLLTMIVTAAMLSSASHGATTLEALRDNNELRASVRVDSDDALYQRAPFILVVEIATARWFSRGTQVSDFRIPGAVVRPVSNFADNSSRRIDGDTWSVQRWRFRVFPQEAGLLELPSLQVFASVNTAEHGAVEGEFTLTTTPVQIVATPGVDESLPWIATSSLTIDESWEGLRDNYIPGDAITRTRHFTVQEAPGMMIEASEIADIDGLSLYQAPAEVADQSNRGTLLGTRKETLIVTFESPGNYQLPGLEYQWFDTQKNSVETISLPAIDLEVVAFAQSQSTADGNLEIAINGPVLLITAVVLTLVLLLWLTRNTGLSRHIHGRAKLRLERMRQYRRFLRALQDKNSALCLQLLFDQLTQTGSQRQLRSAIGTPNGPLSNTEVTEGRQSLRLSLEQLLEHAYGGGALLPDQKAAVALWKAVSQSADVKKTSQPLRLNPVSSVS